MTLERLEALGRDLATFMGGDPAYWRGAVELIRKHLAPCLPHFTPATAAELETLFAHDVGEGPTDPDPGF